MTQSRQRQKQAVESTGWRGPQGDTIGMKGLLWSETGENVGGTFFYCRGRLIQARYSLPRPDSMLLVVEELYLGKADSGRLDVNDPRRRAKTRFQWRIGLRWFRV